MAFEDKDPAIKNLLNAISKSATGNTAEDNIKKANCTTCGNSIMGFRNGVSKKEYKISGMCQKC